jgi:O-antigen ligase
MNFFKVNQNSNFNIFKLYYLLPFLLITGPFLPDLLVSLCSIFFLFYFTLYQNKIFKFSWVLYFFLFYIILILSSFFSNYPIYSLKSSLPYLRFLLLILSVYYLLKIKILTVSKFYLSLIILIIFLSIDALIQFISGTNILGWSSPLPYRITSFFHEKAVLGGFVMKLVPLFIFLHFVSDNFRFKNYLFVITLIFAFLTIIISGDRSAFYILIFFIILTNLIFINKKNFLLGVTVISLIFLFILNNNILKNRLLFMTYDGFFTTLESYNPNLLKNNMIIERKKIDKIKFYISDDHHHHMLTAIAIFKEYPWLGSGPNTFRILCQDKRFYIKENSCTTHPHNFYFQLLAETGIFGFLFLSFLFLKISYFLLKKWRVFLINKINYFILFNCLILLFPMLPNGNFFNNWLAIINFFPFGFYLYYFKKSYSELK